jgi:hypothetical protein
MILGRDGVEIITRDDNGMVANEGLQSEYLYPWGVIRRVWSQWVGPGVEEDAPPPEPAVLAEIDKPSVPESPRRRRGRPKIGGGNVFPPG